MVQAIDPASRMELQFSEYIHFVSYVSMLARSDVVRFIFGHVDIEERAFLKKDQFIDILNHITEGSDRSIKIWVLQYDTFKDPKLDALFLAGFDDFVCKNPSSTWQVEYLQRLIMEANLGTAYWEKKMEQFRITRADMELNVH